MGTADEDDADGADDADEPDGNEDRDGDENGDGSRDRFRVRSATTADADAVVDVHTTSIRDLGSEAYDDRQVRAWLASVRAREYPLDDPGFRAVVAERGDNGDDSDIVGFGLLEFEPDDHGDRTGVIAAVYVRPDHAREGVGSTILAALETTARDSGLEALVLTASRNAIDFYRQQGYEGVETVALEMQDGVSLECLRMRKEPISGGRVP